MKTTVQEVNARVDITSSSVMALQTPVPEGNIINEYTRNVEKNKFTKRGSHGQKLDISE